MVRPPPGADRRRVSDHHGRAVPTAFASTDPLAAEELAAAGPPRYPRPSRLALALEVTPAKAAEAAERLGLRPGGGPPQHPPPGPPQARTIAPPGPGGTAA